MQDPNPRSLSDLRRGLHEFYLLPKSDSFDTKNKLNIQHPGFIVANQLAGRSPTTKAPIRSISMRNSRMTFILLITQKDAKFVWRPNHWLPRATDLDQDDIVDAPFVELFAATL